MTANKGILTILNTAHSMDLDGPSEEDKAIIIDYLNRLGIVVDDDLQPTDPNDPYVKYTDLSSSTYGIDLVAMIDYGVMNGVSATKIDPFGKLTRAQAITMLYRAYNYIGSMGGILSPDTTKKQAESVFSDVSPDNWAYQAALWGYNAGIIKGTGLKDGKPVFSPDGLLTQQELLVMVYRMLDFIGARRAIEQLELKPLLIPDDSGDIADWAVAAYVFADTRGYVIKSADGYKLQPLRNLTREEFAHIINLMITDYKETKRQDFRVIDAEF
jgi:hypothetical protein